LVSFSFSSGKHNAQKKPPCKAAFLLARFFYGQIECRQHFQFVSREKKGGVWQFALAKNAG